MRFALATTDKHLLPGDRRRRRRGGQQITISQTQRLVLRNLPTNYDMLQKRCVSSCCLKTICNKKGVLHNPTGWSKERDGFLLLPGVDHEDSDDDDAAVHDDDEDDGDDDDDDGDKADDHVSGS